MKQSKNTLQYCRSMLFILALVWAGAACDQASMPDLTEDADAEISARAALADAFALGEAGISGDVAAQLAQVRRLTAPFQQIQKANRAGWVAPLSPCVADPDLGGMGYHIGNPEYLENGILDPLMPEVLMYEPMKNGRLRLVGVEYIVSFIPQLDENGVPVPGPGIPGDQPSLFGQDFDSSPHVGPFGSWTLHVWLWRNNPAGMFAPFNPNVSCDYSG
jgi:hypothetical protein